MERLLEEAPIAGQSHQDAEVRREGCRPAHGILVAWKNEPVTSARCYSVGHCPRDPRLQT